MAIRPLGGGIGLVALATLGLSFAPSADAATFTVNALGDASDLQASQANDGICDSDLLPEEQCTLRAALQEAEGNDNPAESDAVAFNLPSNSTIQLSAQLPGITEPIVINGCSESPNSAGPCVGIRGLNESTDAFTVGGPDAAIRGLAITHSNRAVFYTDEGTGLDAQNNWFGRSINGVPERNLRGLRILGDSATIGGTAGASGTTPADRNTFSYNFHAISLLGADDTRIVGNYIVASNDGMTDLGECCFGSILVASAEDDPALGTVIGGPDPGTPTVCDGPCNVIGQGFFSSIDLIGEGPQSAGESLIRGNFIGVKADGSGLFNRGGEIRTVAARDVTIGGPDPADRNYIAVGISADEGAPNLTIEQNYVGFAPQGAGPLIEAGPAVRIRSVATDPARFASNRVAGGISVKGVGAEIDGNVVGIGPGGDPAPGPVEAGIEASDLFFSEIEDNIIGNAVPGPNDEKQLGPAGIILHGRHNVVAGNFIGTTPNGNDHGNAGPGILISGVVESPATDNTIGGDTEAEENVISHNAGDAIEIVHYFGEHNDRNRILNNRGIDNEGLFVDLGPPGGPGNDAVDGANEGIQAPVVLLAATDHIIGIGAPFTKARIFLQPDPAGSDIAEFYGETLEAGAEGFWFLSTESMPQLNTGQAIAVAQTTPNGNTSEFTKTTVSAASVDETPPEISVQRPRNLTRDRTPTASFLANEQDVVFLCRVDEAAFRICPATMTLAPPLPDGTHELLVYGLDPGGNLDFETQLFEVDTTAPDTRIFRGPRGLIQRQRVSFAFRSDDSDATFQCRMDERRFRPCASPQAYRELSHGDHLFRVRARDRAGNVDPSPAHRRFTVGLDSG
jgi:hypothetical protein